MQRILLLHLEISMQELKIYSALLLHLWLCLFIAGWELITEIVTTYYEKLYLHVMHGSSSPLQKMFKDIDSTHRSFHSSIFRLQKDDVFGSWSQWTKILKALGTNVTRGISSRLAFCSHRSRGSRNYLLWTGRGCWITGNVARCQAPSADGSLDPSHFLNTS